MSCRYTLTRSLIYLLLCLFVDVEENLRNQIRRLPYWPVVKVYISYKPLDSSHVFIYTWIFFVGPIALFRSRVACGRFKASNSCILKTYGFLSHKQIEIFMRSNLPNGTNSFFFLPKTTKSYKNKSICRKIFIEWENYTVTLLLRAVEDRELYHTKLYFLLWHFFHNLYLASAGTAQSM
jgi:hypothetical protein